MTPEGALRILSRLKDLVAFQGGTCGPDSVLHHAARCLPAASSWSQSAGWLGTCSLRFFLSTYRSGAHMAEWPSPEISALCLCAGEAVAVEALEAVYARNPLVAQIFLHVSRYVRCIACSLAHSRLHSVLHQQAVPTQHCTSAGQACPACLRLLRGVALSSFHPLPCKAVCSMCACSMCACRVISNDIPKARLRCSSSSAQGLVAVVVPEQGPFMEWALSYNLPGTFAEVCASHLARLYILQRLVLHGKAAQLKVGARSCIHEFVCVKQAFAEVCASHLARLYILQRLVLHGKAAQLKVSVPTCPLVAVCAKRVPRLHNL